MVRDEAEGMGGARPTQGHSVFRFCPRAVGALEQRRGLNRFAFGRIPPGWLETMGLGGRGSSEKTIAIGHMTMVVLMRGLRVSFQVESVKLGGCLGRGIGSCWVGIRSHGWDRTWSRWVKGGGVLCRHV